LTVKLPIFIKELNCLPVQVNGLIAARLTAKLNRDFNTADAIRDELIGLGVEINDGRKEWRVDGNGFLGAAPSPFTYTRAAGATSAVDVALVEKLISDRGAAKVAK